MKVAVNEYDPTLRLLVDSDADPPETGTVAPRGDAPSKNWTEPVALAGVIGGELSAISSESAEIVVESAAFAPSPVRLTSKKLGIKTESSYRFERGSDYDMVLFASRRYLRLAQAAHDAAATIDSSSLPAVTILKPVHGMEPRLRENLASFFLQPKNSRRA